MSDIAAASQVEAFDLRALPVSFYENPYLTYRELREATPVARMPDGSLFLTRYADIAEIYREPRLFSSDKKVEFAPKFGRTPLYEHHTTSLVFNDPPLHTRVRRLIAGALTSRAVAEMEPSLIRLVGRLLDQISTNGDFDIVEDFAAAIPVEVIGNLLTVPQQDRGPLRGWSLAILGALEFALSPEQQDAGNRAVVEFCDYLARLVAERRRRPGDPARDVLTRLIQGEGDERLSEAELLQNCIFILNAGHETTTNLIANTLVTLATFPEVRSQLLQDPKLIGSAVEEFLRFESSNQLGNRISTAPAEIAGIAIPAGQPITLCIGAANRDPAQFPDPDRLDITRRPNRHLAFGLGIHQCAGLQVARLEGQIAIGRFLARFPDYRLTDTPVRGHRARFRTLVRAPAAIA